MDDHPKGALLLIRVAKNISRFPARKLNALSNHAFLTHHLIVYHFRHGSNSNLNCS